MKDRTPLALMEQILMLLVLAVVAAFCLRAFVWADGQSASYARQDEAMRQMQSAAEVIKSTHGDMAQSAEILGGSRNGDELTLEFECEGVCTLIAKRVDSVQTGLGKARITVDFDGEAVGELTVCFQEVGS